MKKIILIFAFLLTSVAGHTQSVNIHKMNGEVISVPLSDLNYMDFSGDNDAVGPPKGVEAVDLGLPSGTKWANMNVGATKPEEYGGYFAYGETEEKELYIADTYKEPVKTGDEYKEGYWPLESILYTQYDVAHVKWGGTWHLPTVEQWVELRDNTSTKWSQLNGVNGCQVKSKRNGKSIFLPATGYRQRSSVKYVSTMVCCWAEWFQFCYEEKSFMLYMLNNDSAQKYNGFPVRPVSD